MSFAKDLVALRAGSLTFNRFEATHTARFSRWAAHFYNRWPQSALDMDDLVQEGLLEAWRAVDEWDPSKPVKLERFVEYRVGRKLRVELERVLGWPKKSRGQKAVRPESLTKVEVARTVARRLVDTSVTPPDRIELAEVASVLDDPMARDVVAAVGLGMSIRTAAARIYDDPDRREAYGLKDSNHALLRAHAAARKAGRQIESVHPGGLRG